MDRPHRNQHRRNITSSNLLKENCNNSLSLLDAVDFTEQVRRGEVVIDEVDSSSENLQAVSEMEQGSVLLESQNLKSELFNSQLRIQDKRSQIEDTGFTSNKPGIPLREHSSELQNQDEKAHLSCSSTKEEPKKMIWFGRGRGVASPSSGYDPSVLPLPVVKRASRGRGVGASAVCVATTRITNNQSFAGFQISKSLKSPETNKPRESPNKMVFIDSDDSEPESSPELQFNKPLNAKFFETKKPSESINTIVSNNSDHSEPESLSEFQCNKQKATSSETSKTSESENVKKIDLNVKEILSDDSEPSDDSETSEYSETSEDSETSEYTETSEGSEPSENSESNSFPGSEIRKHKSTAFEAIKSCDKAKKIVDLKELHSDDSESETESKPKLQILNQLNGLNISSQKVVTVVSKPKHRIKYDCTSIGDCPGKVLVRGPLILPPLISIKNFIHYEVLQRNINQVHIKDFNMMQLAVTPHLLRGDDCFIIGGRLSGKTLSYMIPMIGDIQNQSQGCSRSSNGITSGPIAVIICSDTKSARKIEGSLSDLLAFNPSRIGVELVKDDSRIDRMKLDRGVDILITTIKFATRMLDSSHNHFRFDRLRFLVFEDVDIILQSYAEEIDMFLDATTTFVSKHIESQPHQRIFCGREWGPEVEDFYLRLKPLPGSTISTPIVHINSPNQAIKYSSVKWYIEHVVDEEQKTSKLISLLRSLELFKHRAIFVVCSTPEIANEIYKELLRVEMTAFLAEMDTLTQNIGQQWRDRPSDRKIMVVHDDILRDLKIHNVTCLIHYDLPKKESKYIKSSAGADRFSCMWANFRDIAEEKENPDLKYQRQDLESYFLLTGSEDVLHKLKKFAMKLGCHMPDHLSKIADELADKELERLPLCEGVKLFGKCVEPVADQCGKRHFFCLWELEEEPIVPRMGEIEVRISECMNPSLYTGQVLRCYEYKDGKRVLKATWIQRFNDICKKLLNHYSSIDSRIPPEPCKIGTICAVQLDEDSFARCKITKILTRTDNKYPKTVRVYCVDTGEYKQPSASTLFRLPAYFQEMPHLAVEIVLSNLLPPNGELEYDLSSIKKAKKFTLDKILQAKVHLAVGGTVWVNPLQDLTRDPDSDNNITTRTSIRLQMINNNYAEHNEPHLEQIINLCKKTGFTCAEFKELEDNPVKDTVFMSKFFDLDDAIQWAHLSTISVENFSKAEETYCWITYTKDPHNIFATNSKFIKQLDAVVDELNETISEMIASRCSNYATQFAELYQEDMAVAVKDAIENRWVRGLIIKKHENGTYDVLLVDIGDTQRNTTSKQLFPILRNLVNRLPFQTIALELSHIMPYNNDESWSEESIQSVIDLTLDKNFDGIELNIVPLQGRRDSTFPGRLYSAIIFSTCNEDIGQLLVDKGVAVFTKDGQDTLTSVKKAFLETWNKMYQDKQAAEEGSDSDSQETDLGATFDDDENEDWDVVGFKDFAQALKDKNGINKLEPPQLSGTAEPKDVVSQAAITNETDSNQPALPAFSDILHPNVIWKQTNESLILTVNLPDIREYTIKVDGIKVSFRTSFPPNYGFDLDCYGKVTFNDEDVKCTGQYMKIILQKRTAWLWPQLQAVSASKLKKRWLKEELHEADEECEDEADSKPCLSPISKRKFKISNEYEDTDSDDSDDELRDALEDNDDPVSNL